MLFKLLVSVMVLVWAVVVLMVMWLFVLLSVCMYKVGMMSLIVCVVLVLLLL